MYKVLRTDKAEDQLRDIIYYIAAESGVELALACLDKIEASMQRLAMFPESGSIPRYSIIKKQGYRIVIVDKHLILYKVNDKNKTVIIYAIVDGRREYLNLF